jgi:hypothetical protein
VTSSDRWGQQQIGGSQSTAPPTTCPSAKAASASRRIPSVTGGKWNAAQEGGEWGFEPNRGALIPELLSLPLGGPIPGYSARRSLVKVIRVHDTQIGQSSGR